MVSLGMVLSNTPRGQALTHAPCLQAHEKMIRVANEALLGVAVLSPHYMIRKWPLRELQIFVDRKAVLPLFYQARPSHMTTDRWRVSHQHLELPSCSCMPRCHQRIVGDIDAAFAKHASTAVRG